MSEYNCSEQDEFIRMEPYGSCMSDCGMAQLQRGVCKALSVKICCEWVWSEKAENTQKWANKCGLKISPRDQRVINSVTCGENVLLSSYPRTWAEATQVWYSQSFKYGYGATMKNVSIKSCTQLIWYNSYQMGYAVAYCPRNRFNYFYIFYCPPGNNAMQIATPYKSRSKCADCAGHYDRGLCTNPCKYQDFFGNCRNLKILCSCNCSLVKEKGPATCGCTTQII
ncbi:LOW QUALITY PROTEIN: cysteine-rich venom protein DIS2-like [Morus bassanus]